MDSVTFNGLHLKPHVSRQRADHAQQFLVGELGVRCLVDRAAAVSPFHWLFALGIVLILAVRYAPNGIVGLLVSPKLSFFRKKT